MEKKNKDLKNEILEKKELKKNVKYIEEKKKGLKLKKIYEMKKKGYVDLHNKKNKFFKKYPFYTPKKIYYENKDYEKLDNNEIYLKNAFCNLSLNLIFGKLENERLNKLIKNISNDKKKDFEKNTNFENKKLVCNNLKKTEKNIFENDFEMEFVNNNKTLKVKNEEKNNEIIRNQTIDYGNIKKKNLVINIQIKIRKVN